jgi:hypothetical protein
VVFDWSLIIAAGIPSWDAGNSVLDVTFAGTRIDQNNVVQVINDPYAVDSQRSVHWNPFVASWGTASIDGSGTTVSDRSHFDSTLSDHASVNVDNVGADNAAITLDAVNASDSAGIRDFDVFDANAALTGVVGSGSILSSESLVYPSLVTAGASTVGLELNLGSTDHWLQSASPATASGITAGSDRLDFDSTPSDHAIVNVGVDNAAVTLDAVNASDSAGTRDFDVFDANPALTGVVGSGSILSSDSLVYPSLVTADASTAGPELNLVSIDHGPQSASPAIAITPTFNVSGPDSALNFPPPLPPSASNEGSFAAPPIASSLAATASSTPGPTILAVGDLGDYPASVTNVAAPVSNTTSSGLVINITYDASVADAPAAFKSVVASVVQFYESEFTNPITLNINVGWGEVDGQSLGASDLGESESFIEAFSYSQIRNALIANATSATQQAADGTLPASAPANGTYYLTLADATALGLISGSTTLDGYVGFDSSATWTYNNSSGVPAGNYDLYGVVAHELSEVMGRISMLNSSSSYSDLDLFRYSSPGVRTFVGTQTGYFSANGGTTNLNYFNSNPNGDFGDWATSAGNDSYDAFSNSGVVNPVTQADLTVMNVLGYNPASTGTGPTVSSITATSDSGASDLNVGHVVTITLDASEAVFVTGTPTLQLNDSEAATYTGGSSSNQLTFSYTVKAGDNVADLMVTGLNLAGGAIKDGSGNALSGSVQGNLHLQIDTTPPTVSSISATTDNGATTVATGHVVTITLDTSEAAFVTGTPTLQLNDNEVASYTGGSGTNLLTFSYTVQAADTTSDLTVTGLNLLSATIKDGAGNALSGTAQGNLNLAINAPTVSSITASTDSGGSDLNAGHVVTITLDASAAVFVTGTPTLQLNDNEVATYTGGSSTNQLTFSYTVKAGDNVADLAVTGLNLSGGSIDNGSGTPLSGPVQDNLNLQIQTTAPTVASVTAVADTGTSSASTGHVVTITLDTSEAVLVTGTPTLQLNDNEVATYMGGSGTNKLTFSYTVQAADTTSDLTVTGLNLSSATIKDGAGNALSGTAQGNLNLAINPPGPTVSSITAVTDTGTSSASTGHVVTITLDTSEAVFVTGTPTLQLNDNEVATYTGGSGTNQLTFSYTVQAADTTPDLMVTGLILLGFNGPVRIADASGHALSGSVQANLNLEINFDSASTLGVAFYNSPTSSDNSHAISLLGLAAHAPTSF